MKNQVYVMMIPSWENGDAIVARSLKTIAHEICEIYNDEAYFPDEDAIYNQMVEREKKHHVYLYDGSEFVPNFDEILVFPTELRD